MVNRIFSTLILLIAIAFFIQSRNFSEKTGMQTFAPSFFPTMILAILTILAITLFIRSFIEEKENLLIIVKTYVIEHWRVVTILSLLFIYIFMLPNIGFLVSTITFLLIVFTILGPLKKNFLILNAIMAIILPFGIQWVFQSILNIYLL